LTLFTTFVIIFIVEGQSAHINGKYAKVDCSNINKLYQPQ
jgi:hypothetical protein